MKLKLRFILNDRNKGAQSLCGVSLRIGYNRKYSFCDTGIEVYKKQFDNIAAKNGSWNVIKNHPKSFEYIGQLKSVYNDADTIYRKMILNNEHVSSRRIKEGLKFEGNCAIETFKRILDEERKIAIETKKAISSMITRLSEFNPGIKVESIDYQFAKSFEVWLLRQPNRVGGVLSVNTTNKYLRDLSRMLTRCIKYEIISSNKLQGYDHIVEQRGSGGSIDALTVEELEYIEHVDLSEKLAGGKLESIRNTLDAFLFSVYTGMRLGDIMRVCPNWLDGDILKYEPEKGKRRRKSPEVVHLPIKELFEGKGYILFKQYSEYKIGSTPIFADRSRITHQANMRFIQPMYFPGKKISFHSARHTFETLLREKGISPFTIQRFMNHKSVNTTTNVYDHSSWNNQINEIRDAFKKAE